MRNPHPFDYDDARAAVKMATIRQEEAEKRISSSVQDFAVKRQKYQEALAIKILELKAEGTAWSACGDVARGDKEIARLRREKDIAEGMVEAARSAIWRHTADRKDLARLIDWSRRVAPDGQEREPV